MAGLLVAGGAGTGQGGEPHPETGREYWAIQAPSVTNSLVVFGRISAILAAGNRDYEPALMRVDIAVSEVLKGHSPKTVAVYEPVRRFREYSTRRSTDGEFVFYLEPRTNGIGHLTYWAGFGVRSVTKPEKEFFAGRLREFEDLRNRGLTRETMLDWGLRCCEQRITAWDGLVAIRNALDPGADFRRHRRALEAATAERRERMKRIFDRIRDDWVDDWRLATTVMEAFAWLVDDRYFHHEVRHYSSRLIQYPADWSAHLRAFWRDYESRLVPTEQ